jgi:hypothetical protein
VNEPSHHRVERVMKQPTQHNRDGEIEHVPQPIEEDEQRKPRR